MKPEFYWVPIPGVTGLEENMPGKLIVLEGTDGVGRSTQTRMLRNWLESSGLAVYDTMQLIRAPVSTICVGMAASMATVLLCAGAKGKRYALPHSTMHMHQAAGGAQGQASDLVIQAKEVMRLQDIIKDILVKHTNQPLDKITHDIDRDYYLNPEQAKEYGIIDEILTKPEEKPKEKK